jgi:hypothetical protein
VIRIPPLLFTPPDLFIYATFPNLPLKLISRPLSLLHWTRSRTCFSVSCWRFFFIRGSINFSCLSHFSWWWQSSAGSWLLRVLIGTYVSITLLTSSSYSRQILLMQMLLNWFCFYWSIDFMYLYDVSFAEIWFLVWLVFRHSIAHHCHCICQRSLFLGPESRFTFKSPISIKKSLFSTCLCAVFRVSCTTL